MSGPAIVEASRARVVARLALVAAVLAPGPVGAQPERLGNGVVAVRPLAGPLQAVLDAPGALRWVGYEVLAPPGDRWMCDWTEWTRRQPAARSARLEPADAVYVFYRLESGHVDRVRVFSPGCAIDAGGRPVEWLTGVTPAESVGVLAALARQPERRVVDGALAALSLHAAPQALAETVAVARYGATPHARGQALFWLAQRAGAQAVGAIDDAVARDPDTDVKKRAVFALSQLPADEGVPRLIQVARSHSNAAVRKQAMFWLGQSNDPRALAFFESVLLK
jgi:hypothetical protein